MDSEFNSEITFLLIADNIMQWDDPLKPISIIEKTDSMKVDKFILLNKSIKVPIPYKSPLKKSLPALTDPL
jgi:hypothetical protein